MNYRGELLQSEGRAKKYDIFDFHMEKTRQ